MPHSGQTMTSDHPKAIYDSQPIIKGNHTHKSTIIFRDEWETIRPNRLAYMVAFYSMWKTHGCEIDQKGHFEFWASKLAF